MELSVAMEQSKEKSCGVCFEVIVEKPHNPRFGILPNCNHCFCLSCIMKWRQEKQMDNEIIRACPECRITSNFVCPSKYWVNTKEEKDKLIADYKNASSTKHCKHFNRGEGQCPFGNKCFFLHALPNGAKVDVGPPRSRQRRNRHRDSRNVLGLDFVLHELIDEVGSSSDVEDTYLNLVYRLDEFGRFMGLMRDFVYTDSEDTDSDDSYFLE